MKKIFKGIVLLVLFSLLAYLGYGVVTKMQYKNKVETQLKTIPNFSFKTSENTHFTQANLKRNIPTLFIYFNTECDYCQHEAQSIQDHLEQFKEVQILFVSTESMDVIKTFAKRYSLNHKPNITFLQDNTHTFSTQFDANSIPFMLLYNKYKALIKKHKGQLKA